MMLCTSEISDTVYTITWALMTFLSFGIGFLVGLGYSEEKRDRKVKEYNAKRRAKYAERKAKEKAETSAQ